MTTDMSTITDLVTASNAIRERDELIARLITARDGLLDEVSGLKDQAAWLRTRAVTAEQELSIFQDKVRDKAIRTQENHDGHIDVPELNEWLTDLGLDPWEVEWEVEVEATRTYRGTVTVTATNSEDAAQNAIDGFDNGSFTPDNDLEEQDSTYEVTDTTQA